VDEKTDSESTKSSKWTNIMRNRASSEHDTALEVASSEKVQELIEWLRMAVQLLFTLTIVCRDI